MADSDHHDTPGEPPTIRDEAADSPLWLPALGLTLLILGALVIAWRSSSADEVTDAEVAAEVPPAEEGAPDGEPEAAADDAPAPE